MECFKEGIFNCLFQLWCSKGLFIRCFRWLTCGRERSNVFPPVTNKLDYPGQVTGPFRPNVFKASKIQKLSSWKNSLQNIILEFCKVRIMSVASHVTDTCDSSTASVKSGGCLRRVETESPTSVYLPLTHRLCSHKLSKEVALLEQPTPGSPQLTSFLSRLAPTPTVHTVWWLLKVVSSPRLTHCGPCQSSICFFLGSFASALKVCREVLRSKGCSQDFCSQRLPSSYNGLFPGNQNVDLRNKTLTLRIYNIRLKTVWVKWGQEPVWPIESEDTRIPEYIGHVVGFYVHIPLYPWVLGGQVTLLNA